MNPTNCCDSVYMIRSLVLEDGPDTPPIPSFLLQENSDLLLQEDGHNILI